MTRRAYIYFGLTFILGLIVGSLGMLFYGWHGGYWHRRPPKGVIVRRLTRDLNLTDTQVQQLRQIMEDTSRKFNELRTQVEPQFRAVREESQERTRKILNPDQLEKFNALIRRREERMKKRGAP